MHRHLLAGVTDGIVISDLAEAATYVDDGDHRHAASVARGQFGGVAVVHNHLREQVPIGSVAWVPLLHA